MCGRFTLSYSQEALNQFLFNAFDIKTENTLDVPRYNIAPSQKILSVIHDGSKYRHGYIEWGFLPSWAKDENTKYHIINARSESILDKPTFASSFKSRRCLILADGFYEWEHKKIPMHFHMEDKSLFAMAGLWNTTVLSDGTKKYTCTILTTKSNKLVSSIHDRMPVIIPKDAYNTWLDKATKTEKLTPLLSPYDPTYMSAHVVSSLVNNAHIDQSSCMNPIETNR